MQFIKNKTTHTVKWLLASSSVLILNGNMCTSKTQPPSHQKLLQPDSAYTSIIANPEKKQKTIKKLSELEDAFKRLASNSKAVRRLLSQEISSIPQPSFDGTYSNPTDAVPSNNNKKEAIYAEPIDTKIEEHIYETIGEKRSQEPTYAEPLQNHTYGNLGKEQTTEL